MKSYKQKFYDNLDTEISDFKEAVLSQSPQEIYEDCYRIHFYESMNDYLRWEDFKTEEYRLFLQSDKRFLYNLWRECLKWDDFHVGDLTDASCLVDTYIRNCLAEPVPNCM